ncbi:MAG: hypothetical protein K6D54_06085 [Bacteroidales bacterium]|nr:hypothetical protein [Bacteroidales bacterium]
MKSQRTKIEKLLVFIAWAGLVCGLLVGTWAGVMELVHQTEMCVPRAFLYFAGSYSVSITCWALILELVAIADRLRDLRQ